MLSSCRAISLAVGRPRGSGDKHRVTSPATSLGHYSGDLQEHMVFYLHHAYLATPPILWLSVCLYLRGFQLYGDDNVFGKVLSTSDRDQMRLCKIVDTNS
jgi:hypothetical protein